MDTTAVFLPHFPPPVADAAEVRLAVLGENIFDFAPYTLVAPLPARSRHRQLLVRVCDSVSILGLARMPPVATLLKIIRLRPRLGRNRLSQQRPQQIPWDLIHRTVRVAHRGGFVELCIAELRCVVAVCELYTYDFVSAPFGGEA